VNEICACQFARDPEHAAGCHRARHLKRHTGSPADAASSARRRSTSPRVIRSPAASTCWKTSTATIVLNPCVIRGAATTKRVHKIRPASLPELAKLTAAMPEHQQALILLAAWCASRFRGADRAAPPGRGARRR